MGLMRGLNLAVQSSGGQIPGGTGGTIPLAGREADLALQTMNRLSFGGKWVDHCRQALTQITQVSKRQCNTGDVAQLAALSDKAWWLSYCIAWSVYGHD
jgi:hypothetical protein